MYILFGTDLLTNKVNDKRLNLRSVLCLIDFVAPEAYQVQVCSLFQCQYAHTRM